MRHRKSRWFGALAMAGALAVGTAGTAQAADTITLGWTNWADAEFMIELVQQQLEAHTALEVNAKGAGSSVHYNTTAAPGGGLTLGGSDDSAGSKLTIAAQYKAVANGDIDGMIMAWLPDTHKDYWKKVHDDVINLGPMYTGAIVGWAVPAYVSAAKIDSIADLKDPRIAKQLGGKIVGIDPGAGEMKESKQALKDYDLSGAYKLQEGSDETMTAALAQAVQNLEPIVVTLWTPHWANAKWDMRFLKDPKGEFGGPQHVDVIVRKGFRQDYPKAAKFLSNLQIPIDKLQHAMHVAQQTNEETAVKQFVNNNPGLVAAWWIGTGASVSGAAADASID